MSTERNLWGWLRRGTMDLGGLDMQRVENGVSVGVPDVEGCNLGAQFWMELKCEPRPKRASTLIRVREAHFRQQQVPWLRRRWRACGNCSVLVQVGEAARARRYLIAGCDAYRLIDGVTESLLEDDSLVDPTAKADAIVKAASTIYMDWHNSQRRFWARNQRSSGV